MRYETWDVLLFPETSKVPIQEFKTQCTVTQGRDSPYISGPLAGPQNYISHQGNMSALPVLTTYIPGLLEGTPFRASIHSWDRPRPSRLMDSLMQSDDALLFQAQVYIDGVAVSGCVFGQRTSWPHVIDLSPSIDKNGNQELLRFPPFHESLQQRINGHGRIVIVIAEGFARPHRSPPIERVRDVIAFSFQHAPLRVLELNSIAWPNPSMWAHAPQLFQYNSGNAFSDLKGPEDVHTHSPTRHESREAASASVPALYNTWAYKSLAMPPTPWPNNHPDPWANTEYLGTNPFTDAFMLPEPDPHRGARSYRDDISMPDYKSSTSASSSSRAISSMTGISYEHSKQPSVTGILRDDQYGQVFRSFEPPKEPVSAVPAQAPASTSFSTLPIGFKMPPPGAGTRPASNSKAATRQSISSVLKDLSQSGARDMSEFPAKSGKRVPFESIIGDAPTDQFYAMPAMHFRTRGMPFLHNTENEASIETPRMRSGQASHTPTKTPVRAAGSEIGSAKRNRTINPNDLTPGSKGKALATPSDSLEDDFEDDNFVESKLHVSQPSVESSVF